MPNIFGYLLLLGLGDLAISTVKPDKCCMRFGILMMMLILAVAKGKKNVCIFMSSKRGIYLFNFCVFFFFF